MWFVKQHNKTKKHKANLDEQTKPCKTMLKLIIIYNEHMKWQLIASKMWKF